MEAKRKLVYCVYRVGRYLHPYAKDVPKKLVKMFYSYEDALDWAGCSNSLDNTSDPDCPFMYIVSLEEN